MSAPLRSLGPRAVVADVQVAALRACAGVPTRLLGGCTAGLCRAHPRHSHDSVFEDVMEGSASHAKRTAAGPVEGHAAAKRIGEHSIKLSH